MQKGAAFDKEFAPISVEDHKKDIAKFQKEAGAKENGAVAAEAATGERAVTSLATAAIRGGDRLIPER